MFPIMSVNFEKVIQVSCLSRSMEYLWAVILYLLSHTLTCLTSFKVNKGLYFWNKETEEEEEKSLADILHFFPNIHVSNKSNLNDTKIQDESLSRERDSFFFFLKKNQAASLFYKMCSIPGDCAVPPRVVSLLCGDMRMTSCTFLDFEDKKPKEIRMMQGFQIELTHSLSWMYLLCGWNWRPIFLAVELERRFFGQTSRFFGKNTKGMTETKCQKMHQDFVKLFFFFLGLEFSNENNLENLLQRSIANHIYVCLDFVLIKRKKKKDFEAVGHIKDRTIQNCI